MLNASVSQGFGHVSILRAWYAAKPLYMFPTGSIPLTSANIIKLLSQAPDVQAFYGVPFTLKLLADTPDGLRILERFKVVTFGGSPCPDDLGDFLVSEGVPLVAHYGLSTSLFHPCPGLKPMKRSSAEMGHLMESARDFDTDKEWNWVRAKSPYMHNGVHKYLRFEPLGGGTYELYVLDGWQSKVGPTHTVYIFDAQRDNV